MNSNQPFTKIKEKILYLKDLDRNHERFGAETHQYAVNPVLSTSVIEDFEKAYNISLPHDYVIYLTTIANGGVGPYYGLYTFQEAIELSTDYESNTWLADAFPLTQFDIDQYQHYYQKCEDEGEIDLIRRMPMPDPLPGILCLANYGCNCYYILVVTGEQTGKVWFLDGDNETLTPAFDSTGRHQTFIEWYESWLDEELNPTKTNKKIHNTETKTANYDGWRLEAIPKELLICNNLRTLTFSRNELKKYPEEISCFKELRTLDLSMNPLKKLSPEIGKFTKLKRLLINYSEISELPNEIENLVYLEEFSCYYNKRMKVFPQVLNKLVNLKILNLSHAYELSDLSELSELSNLIRLNISSSTKINAINESICGLKNLQQLYLGNTGIAKLPINFDQLTNLTDLEIDADQLDLQDAIEKIKSISNLKYLCICNHPSYPANISELKSIRHLKITQNYDLWRKGLKTFSVAEELTTIPNLHILEFDNNNDQATELPKDIGNLQTLQELYLPRVTHFPESMQGMRQLKLIQGYKEGLTDKDINTLKEWLPDCEIQIW